MIRSIIDFFRDLKLQTKITICIVFVVLVPIIIMLFTFVQPLYEMVVASTIRDEQNASSLIAPQIEEQVLEITGAMDDIMETPFYNDLFGTRSSFKGFDEVESQRFYDFKYVIDLIVNNAPINAVKIYMDIPKDDDFFENVPTSGLFRPESDAVSTYWLGIMHSTNSQSLFCPELYLKKSEIKQYGDGAYIVKSYFKYRGKMHHAFIVLYYDNAFFGDVLKNVTATEGAVSYIINDRDSLVYTTNEALSGTYRLKYEDIRESLLRSNSFVERKIAGVSVYSAYYYIPQSNWIMVNIIPKDPIYAVANRWMNTFFAIVAMCLILSMLVAITFSRSATNRIAAVSRQMSEVHNGPPVPMPMPKQHDEIGELVNTYNYMTSQMNMLILKQEETAEELRIAEINALQAQINPHFLYNTMDMINWMAIQGKTKEVSEVVQNLSKYYKLTLSRKKDYSTIADELDHAQVYIDLQNMRFKDAINFVVDVPDELTVYRLPKLTFQPILENAIIHGILETEEKSGTILLTIWAEGDDIRILISDDGAGMDEATRRSILSEERVKPTNSRGANVAIENIHRRFQLLYGKKYGLSFDSSPGNGCDVTILLPKHLGDTIYVKKE